MEYLTAQLEEARLQAEDADIKSDQISRQLALVEDELESVEERVKLTEAYVEAHFSFSFFFVFDICRKIYVLKCYFFFFLNRSIAEKEDKLFIVGNILKSLEVSEEKVKFFCCSIFKLDFLTMCT